MVWYPGKNIVGHIRDRRDQREDLMDAPSYQQDPTVQPTSPLAGGLGQLQSQGASNFGVGQQAQQQMLGQYQDMAAGQGPSLAQAQLAQSTQQNVADQISMAAQSRGGNLASQARQGAAAGAAAQMGAQQQAAQIRAQEQLAAMQGASALSNQLAGQGLQQQLSGAQMGLAAQGQANQWGLGQRGLDQSQLGLMQQQQQGNRGFGLGLAQLAGKAGSMIGGGVG